MPPFHYISLPPNYLIGQNGFTVAFGWSPTNWRIWCCSSPPTSEWCMHRRLSRLAARCGQEFSVHPTHQLITPTTALVVSRRASEVLQKPSAPVQGAFGKIGEAQVAPSLVKKGRQLRSMRPVTSNPGRATGQKIPSTTS